MNIGQKVVCVDDQNFLAPQLMNEFPKKGVTYTVRGSFPAIDRYGETENILLEELNNPIANNGLEHGFNQKRFRELQKDEMKLSKTEEASL
jgi:AMMECR1 domain-containing protein